MASAFAPETVSLPSAAAPAGLVVRNLSIAVHLRDGTMATVVDNVSFEIPPGGTLGLVGESGSGKTMTSLAIMGLLPESAEVTGGEILLDGEDLLKLSRRQMSRLRGKRIGMIMQDPMTALDPSFTVRNQLAEPLQQHLGLRGHGLDDAIVEAIERVQLSAEKSRLRQYPHQLSGGMRQRITSAIALAGRPGVLIADEPTTALDVTTQARYLQLLRDLQESTGFALLLIAHDLLVIKHVCERVVVMYASKAVETGTTEEVFANSQHPYTRALLRSIAVLSDEITLESIDGQAPEVTDILPGCRFAPRCRFAHDKCHVEPPQLTPRSATQAARCWGTEENGWLRG